MRLSPVLVAVLATSINLGLSDMATAQKTDITNTEADLTRKGEPPQSDRHLEAKPADGDNKFQEAVTVARVPESVLKSLVIEGQQPVAEFEDSEQVESEVAQFPTESSGGEEPQVLVAEVLVTGVEGELEDRVYQVISTQPGRTTTRSRLQQDINAIFATGFFQNVRATPVDTPLGVRITFEVEANPVLRSVDVQGSQVLPEEVIEGAFNAQYGSILNLRSFQRGVEEINKWYQDKGYVLAQVVGAPEVGDDGTVTLQVAEGEIEKIQVRFLNSDGEQTDEEGNPIKGRTREFIITREVELQEGDVFNREIAERDLRRVFNLGIFEDVRLGLEPAPDNPNKAIVIVNVIERSTGSLALGGGLSSASGLFGTVSYQEQNLGGNNQNLGGEVQVGERLLLLDFSFTDPWIAGDPYRTSYTVNAFRRRSISVIFDGGDREVELANGDRPRVLRTGGGVSFLRPLNRNPYLPTDWTASLGLRYERIEIQDADGDTVSRDELGNKLSMDDSGTDDLLTFQFGIANDSRNDPLQPTSGSLFRFGVEQSIPIGASNILLNRLRASYSFYIPVEFTEFSPGPEALAFSIQAGHISGDLPPYEAFPLGGTNTVRGYDQGELAAARTFLVGSVEYRFPLFSFLGGALFFDAGTSFDSQGSVRGNPGGVRDKPGSGFGYGAGLRIQSPLGPIRVDYGFSDRGDSQIQFGVGQSF